MAVKLSHLPHITRAERPSVTKRAKIWSTARKVYVLGILVYFAVAGVRALTIPLFSDWLFFMGSHAIYAVVWPIAWPVAIFSRGSTGLFL